MTRLNRCTLSTISLALSLSVQAGTISDPYFYENFQRSSSNSLSKGWLEIEQSPNDVRMLNGAVRLRDNAEGEFDAAIYRLITADNADWALSFDWSPLQDSGRSDYFRVSWASSWSDDAEEWHTLFATPLNNSSEDDEIDWQHSLIDFQTTGSNFYLMFWTELSGKTKRGDSEDSEGIWLDNITLTKVNVPTQADPLPQAASLSQPTPVPLPATWTLLLAGLPLFNRRLYRAA